VWIGGKTRTIPPIQLSLLICVFVTEAARPTLSRYVTLSVCRLLKDWLPQGFDPRYADPEFVDDMGENSGLLTEESIIYL
jgi:hypothetical protein